MDEKFEPRLGTMQSGGSRPGFNYLQTILTARAVAGPKHGHSSRRFTGRYIGRGAVAARMLTLRTAHDGFHWRRAFVRTRVVRLGPRGMRAAGQHLRYIQHDRLTRDGEPCRLYSANEDDAEGKVLLKRSSGDRHQFRIIVSAEDGAQYDDLKPLIRRFMTRMEEDLETRLEWIAADHVDTPHPHTHVILRGRDHQDGNLIIAPAYICHGMRDRLSGLVSLDLGPRTDFEIEPRLRLEVDAEQLTSIDRRLLEEAEQRLFVIPSADDLLDHSLLIGRLRKLERLGLAQGRGGGRWLLSEDLEPAMLSLGERGDMLRTMERALENAGLDRTPADQRIFRPEGGETITGKIIAEGVEGDLRDRGYLVIDGTDGRSHYVAIPPDELTGLSTGAIVRVSAKAGGPADRPAVTVELLSPVPIERLPGHDGATWLDQLLLSPTDHSRDAGFGREVRAALALRRAWLLSHGLAEGEGTAITFRPELVSTLKALELSRVGEEIAQTTGLEFVAGEAGPSVEGVVRRRIELASGRFMLVANEHEFSLVPWRSDLENALGREVRRTIGAGGISWTIAGSRGLQR